MARQPLISVVLPVYNAEAFVKDAIESILRQTYDNLELIVIDDGSTDSSAQVIEGIKDSRLRMIQQANQGVSATLNRAVHMAQGSYIARQDADDLSLPQRFERQVEFLATHPEVGLVGTWADIQSVTGQVLRRHEHPADNCDLRFELLFDNPFVHSSMMIRREVFERIGFYSMNRSIRAEDYDLWSRASREFEIANIPEVLQIYRDTPGSMSKGAVNPFLDSVIAISIDNLAWVTKRETNDSAINDLAVFAHGAIQRAQGHATLQEMSSILFEAADSLSTLACSSPDRLRQRARDHLRSITYYYNAYHASQGRGLRWRLKHLARRVMQLSA